MIISDETFRKEEPKIEGLSYPGRVMCGSRFYTELSKRGHIASGFLRNRLPGLDFKLPIEKEANINNEWDRLIIKIVFVDVSLSNGKDATGMI